MSHLDPDLVDAHLTAKQTRRLRTTASRRWIAAGAACLGVVMIGIGAATVWDHMHVHYDEPTPELEDVAIAEDFVNIRYVTPDGRIDVVRQYLSCDAYSIFAAWRIQNGLGEDATLVQTRTRSNGIEWTEEYEGEGVVGYAPGDKFYLTITVRGLEPYLAGEHGDALLESLKQTLGGYTGITYESIDVVLE